MIPGPPPTSGVNVLLPPVQGSSSFSPLPMTSFSVPVKAKVNGTDLWPRSAAELWPGYLSPCALRGVVLFGTEGRRLMPWVTHAHSFSALTLAGARFYAPRSTAGATLPWLSLLSLKRERKNLRSSAGALDKLLCLEDAIYDYGSVEKTELGTFVAGDILKNSTQLC